MAICHGMMITCIFILVLKLTWSDGDQYIEYHEGTTNIILSVPHDGKMIPDGIPIRENGCWNSKKERCTWNHRCKKKNSEKCPILTLGDSWTKELALKVADHIEILIKKKPYVIINNLHRSRMDANRKRGEATLGVKLAVDAWKEYHRSIKRAKRRISKRSGTGILFDIHGQKQENWIALGYLISKTQLKTGTFYPAKSSIKSLAEEHGHLSFEQIIHGDSSFGAFLSENGYQVVPSPNIPDPKNGKFYYGGYITQRHGSRDGGKIDAIQIESPKYLRNAENGTKYAEYLAGAIVKFVNNFY